MITIVKVESTKLHGLGGNVEWVRELRGSVGAWIAWVKFLDGLHGLRGSKHFLSGS